MEASTSERRTSLISLEREREAPPSWMMRVMEKNNGFNPCFFGEKTFTISDRDPNQNRFLFHKDHILDLIIPELMEHEIVAANLDNIDNKEKKRNIKKESVSAVKMKKVGRVHEGLPVTVYTMAGWKFYLFLTRWDSKSVILKGREWKYVPVFGNIQVADNVEVWSFRKMERGRLNLCLVIGKTS